MRIAAALLTVLALAACQPGDPDYVPSPNFEMPAGTNPPPPDIVPEADVGSAAPGPESSSSSGPGINFDLPPDSEPGLEAEPPFSAGPGGPDDAPDQMGDF